MNIEKIQNHKLKIKECFNKAARTYDNYSSVQRKAGQTLINIGGIDQMYFPNAIDLGCGTGHVTEELIRRIRYHHFQAVDLSDQLLLVARERLTPYKIQIHEADFDNLNLKHESLDLIFSNMTLQWSLDLEKTLKGIFQKMAQGSLCLFSLPLGDTFQELQSHSKNQFYKTEDIHQILRNTGYTLIKSETQIYTETFNTQFQALKAIKAVGANYIFFRTNKSLSFATGIERPSANSINSSEQFPLTYQIGFFKAKKV
jgi:malonyl-CoA O-methyltransferase